MELLEVRRALELHFVRQAAERATAAHFAAMRSAIVALRSEETENVDAQAAADDAFHEAVAAASANRFMTILMQALASPLHQLRVRSLEGTWARAHSLASVVSGHEAILARIEASDPEGPVVCMATHLRDTWTDLQVPLPRRTAGSSAG